MEKAQWRNDQLFATSMLLGASSHIMYLLSTGRNAWHGTWSARYKGPTSLHFTLAEAKKAAERDRVQGTVFIIEQVPVLAFRCQTGIAYCVEFHSQESFKMLDWDGEMEFLKIGAAMPDMMDVFSKPDRSAWKSPRPNQDSFVTRVFDLVGTVDHSTGKTTPLLAEPMPSNSKLSQWKSYPDGTGYYMGWTPAESERELSSIQKVIDRFDKLNSPKLKLVANTLFVAAENFVRCHYQENWQTHQFHLEAALEELAASFADGSIREAEE